MLYLIFNTLYHKTGKNIFKILAYLPKVILLFCIFILIPLIMDGVHYKRFEDYKNLEIKNVNDIQNLTNIQCIYYYNNHKEISNNYTVLIFTKYEKYTCETNQNVLQLLDAAGTVNDKLIPQEIKDMDSIYIILTIAIFGGSFLVAIFVKDKKNIVAVLGIMALFVSFVITKFIYQI